jgi:hypothetical protein
MYRAIITPKETKLTIDLPEELIGKPVEVLAFELLKTEQGQQRKKPSAEEIDLFYKKYQIDMSNFRFNRDEANER